MALDAARDGGDTSGSDEADKTPPRSAPSVHLSAGYSFHHLRGWLSFKPPVNSKACKGAKTEPR